MEETEILITLRTFSGPNLGAEVMLSAGVYVIGTDFSCDVVLSDSGMAARHAALTVEAAAPGDPPHVSIKPMDAEVLLEDQPIAEAGQQVAPATPWFLGVTCLSWNLPNAPRETFVPNLPGHAPQAADPTAGQDDAPLSFEDTGSAAKPAAPATNVTANAGNKMPTKVTQRHWLVRGGLCIVALLLGALIFDFSSSNSTNDLAESFRRDLHQAGFTSINVAGGDGRLTVAGTVHNEQERAQIWSMARNLKYPVYIRVGVRDDVAKGVTMKLNSSGIFPRVSFPEGKTHIRVAAYIKDQASEDIVFTALAKDMPDLPHIEKHVVYAAQLRDVLQERMHRAGFRNVSFSFSTGRVEVRHILMAADDGPTGAASQETLEKLMQDAEKALGVPLAYTTISQERPEDAQAGAGAAAAKNNATVMTMGGTDLAKLQIAGVTFGAMRFVILSNGQRIFEGGVLPDGHILERVTLNTLILKKNGRTTSYPLRGTSE